MGVPPLGLLSLALPIQNDDQETRVNVRSRHNNGIQQCLES